ncbi:MAG: DUF721 domain-containing protein [Candidatus Omnitrophota bacterium]
MYKKKGEEKHVKRVVDGLLLRWEKEIPKKGNAVLSAWEEAVNSGERGHSQPVSLKKGVLLIVVESSAWLYRLTIEKKKILEKFNKSYTGRKKAEEIRFRGGCLNDGAGKKETGAPDLKT